MQTFRVTGLKLNLFTRNLNAKCPKNIINLALKYGIMKTRITL